MPGASFFYLHVIAVTAPGLTRPIEAEAAYRAGVRVIQPSAEIEPYRVDVIARSGAFESLSDHGYPRHRLYFLLIPSLVTYIYQMAVKPRGFMGRLRR